MQKKRQPYPWVLSALTFLLPLLAALLPVSPALAAPLITLTPTTGAPGTTVALTGSNFESYRGDTVSVVFNNTEVAGSPLTIPQAGSFSLNFAVPGGLEPGNYLVRVRSEQGSTLASSPFTIPQTVIRLTTLEGSIGASVTIAGSGFYSGRLVTIYYYTLSKEKMGTIAAGPTGDFSYSLTIPNSTGGRHRVIAENAEGNSAEASFLVIPLIKLNTPSGAPGDILRVSGSGFGYRSDIGIFFGSTEVAYARSDDYGSFEVTFNVPDITSASYDVKAVDVQNNLSRASFAITAGARLNKKEGPVGTAVTVSGSGFQVGGTVVVQYDATEVARAVADNNGAFNIVFPVPASSSGKHTISVSDGTTARQLTFNVESAPPPIPSPLLPAYFSVTRAGAYLDWTDVSDPSLPVTYRLQIAADQNFAPVTLEKDGIANSEYAVADDEKLPAMGQEMLYYWRVKAVDSAGNESEWTVPWVFRVAAPPVPVPLLPVLDSKAESPVYFDWGDVTDLSPPITYRLQVGSDQSFTSTVLDRSGLKSSEYTLAADEKLPAVRKEAPYYWRVRAVDSAGNESNWTTPRPFYVGFSLALPGWAVFTFIGLGVLLIGFLAFWLGRKTAYFQNEF